MTGCSLQPSEPLNAAIDRALGSDRIVDFCQALENIDLGVRPE